MKRFFVGFFAIIGGFVTLLIIALFFLINTGRVHKADIQSGTVLYLDFSPKMVEYQTNNFMRLFGQETDSLYQIIQTIDRASQDPRVIGIVARLDNVEMGLAQVQEIRNAIMRFRVLGRNQKKFTLAHTDTFGEAGPGTLVYYLASAFDEIWMQPIGSLGFTGLYMEMPFAKEALDKIGVTPEISKRMEYKTAFDTFTEDKMTEPNREELASVLKSLMSQILKDVALAREITESEVEELMHRSPLLGMEALKAGLIDRQAYLDEIEPYIRSKVSGNIHIISASSYLTANPKILPSRGQRKIALIFGTGTILRDAGQGSDFFDAHMMGSHEMTTAFDKARKDEDVAAIVFRVNSPGGSPVASEAILHAVRHAQEDGKRVIVSMSDVAGSGGYWIAAYADKIVAHPSTITGSIGVLGGKVVFKELWDKLGIHWDHVAVGDNATMWSFNDVYTESASKNLNAWLDYIYNQFIDRVAVGRKLPREHVEQIAKGRIWSGEEALKYGLVDNLGDLKHAIDIAKEMVGLKDQEVAVEIFPQPKSLVEQLGTLLYESDETPHTSSGVITPLIKAFYKVSTFMDELLFGFHAEGVIVPIKKVKG